MAKVYDALRRAEERRRENAGQTAGEITAPMEWEPPAGTGRVRRSVSIWRRWIGRKTTSASSADEMNKRRIALLQPDSFVAEQFRTLRARIDSISAERPLHSLMVTSALAGEGKTTASINLALVMAMQINQRVLLVDCDMRKPKIHHSLGIQPKIGLAEVLMGDGSLEEAIVPIEDVALHVLPVHRLPSNPAELLSTSHMRELLGEITAKYDKVVLDTPAALSLPDSKTLSDLVDGIVIVVRADTTPQVDVEATLELLDRRRMLGLVLNGARIPQGRYSYYSS